MKRIIFHIDVNSAFLSWESAARILKGGADLRLVPSCISGNPESRTSVVLAKSIPAKKYGIKTGEPIGAALRKCPDIIIAKPDFSLYQKYSDAFMNICRRYTPVVEKYSIDECFMDMTGTNLLYPDIIKTAYEIKDTIKKELGFTVNIGIGPNKLLAKTAGDFEKPDRVHTLFEDELPEKYWPLPITDLFGVGGATAEKLLKNNIKTIGNLSEAPLPTLKAMLGQKMSEHLYKISRGIDDSPVLEKSPAAKGYSISTTMEKNITDEETAFSVLLSLVDSVAMRMRSEENKAWCVGVSIRTDEFKNSSHQKKLPYPTDQTQEIFEISKVLLRELWNGKAPLRLIGVALSDLTKEETEQISLFGGNSDKRKRKVDSAVDKIRKKYGSDSISLAGAYEENERIGRKYKAKIEAEE
jgi:DNA polymerase-4